MTASTEWAAWKQLHCLERLSSVVQVLYHRFPQSLHRMGLGGRPLFIFTMKVTVLGDVWPTFQRSFLPLSVLWVAIEVVRCSETSIFVYQITRRNIPEDGRLNSCHRESLRCCFSGVCRSYCIRAYCCWVYIPLLLEFWLIIQRSLFQEFNYRDCFPVKSSSCSRFIWFDVLALLSL